MENFKQIDPAEITDNFIRAIGGSGCSSRPGTEKVAIR